MRRKLNKVLKPHFAVGLHVPQFPMYTNITDADVKLKYILHGEMTQIKSESSGSET